MVKDVIYLVVELSSADGQTKTVTDSRITANHVVIKTIHTENGFIVDQPASSE